MQTHKIRLPRDPFSYIAFWQMLTFFMLLLLVWVHELHGLYNFFSGKANGEITIVRGCLLSAAVLAAAIVAVGNTYLQQRRVVRTLLSVCAKCRRVRVGENEWQLLEEYISDNSLLSFSHGLCPDCLAETMHDIQSGKHKPEPI